MRYVVLLYLLINTAFASVNPPMTKALVERETSGGFVPESKRGYSEKISIYPNGEVFASFKENTNASWEHRLLANLPLEILTILYHVVVNTEDGELEFPDGPECTDTPVTSYTITKADGQTVIFAQTVACKTGYLPFCNSYALQNILDGFAAFTNLDVE